MDVTKSSTGKPVMGIHSLLGGTNNGINNNVSSSVFHQSLPTVITKSPVVITTPPTPVSTRAAETFNTSSISTNNNSSSGDKAKVTNQPIVGQQNTAKVNNPSSSNSTEINNPRTTANSSEVIFARCHPSQPVVLPSSTVSSSSTSTSYGNEKVIRPNNGYGEISSVGGNSYKSSDINSNANINKVTSVSSGIQGGPGSNQTSSTVTTKKSEGSGVVTVPVRSQVAGQVEPGQRTNPVINPTSLHSHNNQQQNQTISQSGNNFYRNPSTVTTTTSSSTSENLPSYSVVPSSIQRTSSTNFSASPKKLDTKKMDSLEEGSQSGNLNNNIDKFNSNEQSEMLKPAQPSMSAESTASSSGSFLPSSSGSDNEVPSRPVTAPASLDAMMKPEETIGEDVKMVINLLEKSGLCGPIMSPMDNQSAPGTRPGTSGSDFPPARPSTAEKPNNPLAPSIGDAPNKMHLDHQEIPTVRPSTGKDRKINRPTTAERSARNAKPMQGADGDSPHVNNKAATATDMKNKITAKIDTGLNSNRPPTGSKSRPSTGIIIKSPREKSDKTPNGNAAGTTPKSGRSVPNSTTPVEPKLSKSGRASTPRAASARMSSTALLSSSKSLLDEESNGKRAKSVSQETRAKSAISSSVNNTTPRSRPSSTLYQHTASSAQKGKLSSPSSVTVLNNSNSSRASPSPSTPKSSRPSTRQRFSGFKMGDSAATGAGDAKPVTLKDQFAAFSRFGDTSSDGKHIALSNCDKWMKQAHVIDGKKITTTDTSICFKKLFKTTKKVPLEDFKKYVEDLAKNKKMEPQEILDKLTNCGAPGLSTATKAAHVGVVERLTDTSKYTGSHKERFDATGKGKGIAGRVDVADSSGYVASFKTKLDLKESSPSPTPVAKEASPPK